MNLELLKIQYDNFKDFESKFPGIRTGLEILRILHCNKEDIKLSTKKSNKEKIKHYDFCDNIIYECCSNSLNIKLKFIYKEHYINNKIILFNKLFIICRSILEKILMRIDFKLKDSFNVDDFLKMFFFEGLGCNSGSSLNFLIFYESLILNIFNTKDYFDNSFERVFYMFMEELKSQKFLVRDFENDKVIFNSNYVNDIKNLIFTSYENLNLGTFDESNSSETLWGSRKIESVEDCFPNLKELSDNYSKYTEKQKLILNDELVTLVLIQTTEFFNFKKSTKNFFVKNSIL